MTVDSTEKHEDAYTSLEEIKSWIDTEPERLHNVPVVYYLSRNGQLEHPHFMEVPLSSPQGLHLRDVINRLNCLRGQGFANLYSWSSKRSYKNRFVWQDLSENDLIYPSHGNEYILKGSQLLGSSLSFRIYETLSSSSNSRNSSDSSKDSNFPIITRRKNHSWAAFNELDEPKVYRAKTSGNPIPKVFNMSTQTDDNAKQRRVYGEEGHEENGIVEMSNEDASTPSMDVDGSADIRDYTVKNDGPSGRMKASMVLMQLISCGSRGSKVQSTV